MFEFWPKFAVDIWTVVFFIFAFFAFIQLLFVSLIYARFSFHKWQKKDPTEFHGVSVIIAARNESNNLFSNLPFILEQDYPEFEVIVVNHQSMDDSEYILDAYKHQYPNLKSIRVEKSTHLKFGKKLPLTIGIKGAKYRHLILTDADCQPASRKWLSSVMSNFTDSKEIVLSYGPYFKEPGMVNRFVRFDTAWIAMNYFAMAKSRIPYMGIGRNLAYTKDVFESVSGFKSHYALPSGDDDLFIQESAKKKNYTINIDPDSFCYSKGVKSWEELFNQKSRHYTTAERYKVFKKWMLGIYPLSLLLMTVSFVSLLFNLNFLWLTLAIYLVLTTIKWIILGKAFKKLYEPTFIAWLPLWEIFYSILTPIMYYASDKKDIKKW